MAEDPTQCNLRQAPDYTGVTLLDLSPSPSPADYREAMRIAAAEAETPQRT